MTVRYVTVENGFDSASQEGDVVFQSDKEEWSKITVALNGSEPGSEGVFIGISHDHDPDGAFGGDISARLDTEDVRVFVATVLLAAGLDVPEELR